MLTRRLIALIDIKRSNSCSSFWRFCGFAVIEGKAEKRRKGEKMHYNARIKTVAWLIGRSLLRKGTAYRPIYDAARVEYEARVDWMKGHKHQAAMRKMIKVFLAHLWSTWRRMEGLPAPDLYILNNPDYPGHTHYLKPEDYGWPEV